MDIAQDDDAVESNYKELFTHLFILACPCLFGLLDHSMLSALIFLRSDFTVTNLRTEVLFLTSNNSVNWYSYFLALGFLRVADGPGDIGLLSINPSVMETMPDLRMVL